VRALDAAAKFAEKPLDGFSTPTNAARKEDDPSATPAKSDAAVQSSRGTETQRTQQPAAAGAKYTGEPISVNLKDVT